MEKQLRLQEVVSEKVIIRGKDHKSQYLENENVEIIMLKRHFINN
jgi:hypothetical protein